MVLPSTMGPGWWYYILASGLGAAMVESLSMLYYGTNRRWMPETWALQDVSPSLSTSLATYAIQQ